MESHGIKIKRGFPTVSHTSIKVSSSGGSLAPALGWQKRCWMISVLPFLGLLCHCCSSLLKRLKSHPISHGQGTLWPGQQLLPVEISFRWILSWSQCPGEEIMVKPKELVGLQESSKPSVWVFWGPKHQRPTKSKENSSGNNVFGWN